jgi:hypothetical protein
MIYYANFKFRFVCLHEIWVGIALVQSGPGSAAGIVVEASAGRRIRESIACARAFLGTRLLRIVLPLGRPGQHPGLQTNGVLECLGKGLAAAVRKTVGLGWRSLNMGREGRDPAKILHGLAD